MSTIMSPVMTAITVARRPVLPLIAGMPFATVSFTTLAVATVTIAAPLTMTLTATAAAGMAAFAGRRTVGRVRRCLAGFRSSHGRRRDAVAALRLWCTMRCVPAMLAPRSRTPRAFRT